MLEEIEKRLKERKLPLEVLETYNSKPQVTENGVRLVYSDEDDRKEKKVKIQEEKIDKLSIWNKVLIFILIGFLLCASVFAYLAYNDKLKLLNISIPQCPAVPQCPTQPACPSCPICPICSPTLICNTTTPQINIYTNST
jgi:hypothetical protein